MVHAPDLNAGVDRVRTGYLSSHCANAFALWTYRATQVILHVRPRSLRMDLNPHNTHN